MQYPRIDTFKRRNYVPIYHEYFEVQTRRPNRQLKFKVFQIKNRVNNYINQERECLKKEGYKKAVINGRIETL